MNNSQEPFPKPIRVLFVTTIFDSIDHGPALYAQHIWRHFQNSQDIDLHMLVLNSSIVHPKIYSVVPEAGQSGARVYEAIEARANKILDVLGEHTIVHVNIAHIVSKDFCRRHRCIVQVNDTEVCQWSPKSIFDRSIGLRRFFALGWRRWREKQVVCNAHAVIANSQYTKKMITKCYRLASDRVSTIYKSIELDSFNTVVASAISDRSSTEPRLVFVGSNWHRKGLDLLLAAMKFVNKAVPARLFVYGKPDANTDRYFKQMARDFEIGDRVVFCGPVTRQDLPTVLSQARLFVLPSREEALGVAAIEALAAGVRVVGSDVGGLPEIVSDEICGTLVEPGNVNALAEAILGALIRVDGVNDREHRRSQVQKFDSEEMLLKIERLYHGTSKNITVAQLGAK